MASGAPAGFASQSGLTDDDLVYYIDLSLVGVLGVVTLVYLPRTIARYAHKSGWTEGWMLLRGKPADQYLGAARAYKSEASIRDKDISPAATHQYPPDHSNLTITAVPTLSSATHLGRTPTIKARLVSSNSGESSGSPPAHVPSFSSFVPAITKALEYRIMGYSIRQIAFLLAYLAVICVALFYQSDPRSNTNRAGFVVMSQMPFVFALGTKNSVVTALTGISYEQLNFVHRWVGQLMFLASLFHFVGKLVFLTQLGMVSAGIQSNAWGIVTFSSLCLLAVGSHPWFRARIYSLFVHSHTIGLLAFMIGMWKHQPEVAPPYVATCIALYAADQIARLAKTRLRKAVLTPVPELSSTHVFVPDLDKGWVAGQHIRIRVLSFGLGLFGWAECHPFTIANSGGNGRGLTLVCKSAGDWTSALFRMASNKSNPEEYRSVYVLIEGPYGGPGNTLFTSFSGAMLVLGGSGITFGTSVLEDVVTKKLRGTARTTYLNFIWAVQHPSAADPFLSTLVELAQLAAEAPDLQIMISIFYTRGADDAFILRTPLPPNIQIRSGRPNLTKEINDVLEKTQSSINATQSSKSGVILAGCGPDQLISSVYAAKAGASTEIQRAVGGLELHTETFGW